ncbi:DUF2190 family protein [Jeongeupia chitinilytica]|uniref:DUF2190 family protein n=1 Tax=Jeongeupia chitinilytica TaxID=1041641 RepID=A0ABQ3GXV4_9NEIS|nr:capsid cement protein [Jeongeupia chitinilytica]GHD60370.1 hypothetical protein GCM10007350_13300 [Jeongeupia chitinilytica]
MLNYVQQGDSLTVTAVADTLSGDPILVGHLFGVATHDAPAGQPLTIKTSGVFDLPKLSADEVTVGGPLYFDAAKHVLTGTKPADASTAPFVAVATVAAGNNTGSVRVRLNGVAI